MNNDPARYNDDMPDSPPSERGNPYPSHPVVTQLLPAPQQNDSVHDKSRKSWAKTVIAVIVVVILIAAAVFIVLKNNA